MKKIAHQYQEKYEGDVVIDTMKTRATCDERIKSMLCRIEHPSPVTGVPRLLRYQLS